MKNIKCLLGYHKYNKTDVCGDVVCFECVRCKGTKMEWTPESYVKHELERRRKTNVDKDNMNLSTFITISSGGCD